MPKSLTPALFDITVRPFAPWSRRALIRFSGMPQSPKPDTMIDAPSGTSRTASAALFTTLFMALPGPRPDASMITGRKTRPPGQQAGGGVGVGVGVVSGEGAAGAGAAEGRGEGVGTGSPDGRSRTPTRG